MKDINIKHIPECTETQEEEISVDLELNLRGIIRLKKEISAHHAYRIHKKSLVKSTGSSH